MGGGKGGGRLAGSWDLGTSLDDDPLFRPTMRSLKPILKFKDIGSSSSELLSISVIINGGASYRGSIELTLRIWDLNGLLLHLFFFLELEFINFPLE